MNEDSDARATASDRLTLKPPTLADFEESAAIYGDAGVVRYLGGRPFTREECWARHLRHVGHWQLMGFGFWVVRERDCGRFVGEVGFGELRRTIEPSFEGSPEIGWVLAPDAQGKGYATEAARAALEWFDRHLGTRRTVCMIETGNAASFRVAAKCGYTTFARSTYKSSEVVLLERPPTASASSR